MIQLVRFGVYIFPLFSFWFFWFSWIAHSYTSALLSLLPLFQSSISTLGNCIKVLAPAFKYLCKERKHTEQGGQIVSEKGMFLLLVLVWNPLWFSTAHVLESLVLKHCNPSDCCGVGEGITILFFYFFKESPRKWQKWLWNPLLQSDQYQLWVIFATELSKQVTFIFYVSSLFVWFVIYVLLDDG